MKNILIINGHPDKESFNFALHQAYKAGLEQSGCTYRELILADLSFLPNLQYGYRQRTELEPDLLKAYDDLCWADHIVWIYPVWWGMMPALMKGFIDRLFLPGFTFAYRQDSILLEKLMKGKTAHLITTLDTPVWYFRFFLKASGVRVMRNTILGYCGIKTRKTTYIGPIRHSTEQFRQKHLERIQRDGRRQQ